MYFLHEQEVQTGGEDEEMEEEEEEPQQRDDSQQEQSEKDSGKKIHVCPFLKKNIWVPQCVGC